MQCKVTTGKAVAQFVLEGDEISVTEVLVEALGRHDIKLQSIYIKDNFASGPIPEGFEIELFVEFSYGKEEAASFGNITLGHA